MSRSWCLIKYKDVSALNTIKWLSFSIRHSCFLLFSFLARILCVFCCIVSFCCSHPSVTLFVQLAAVDKARLSLEKQEKETRAQMEEKLKVAAEQRQDYISKMLDRLKMHVSTRGLDGRKIENHTISSMVGVSISWWIATPIIHCSSIAGLFFFFKSILL